MLAIRKQQQDALASYMEESFVDKTAVHLRKFWPVPCRLQSDQELRRSVQEGIKRGRTYGLRTEYDLARYIDLMYALGPDFDVRERNSWAADILANPRLRPASKMDRLYEAAEKHLAEARP